MFYTIIYYNISVFSVFSGSLLALANDSVRGLQHSVRLWQLLCYLSKITMISDNQIDTNEFELRKRLPARFSNRKNDIYITK